MFPGMLIYMNIEASLLALHIDSWIELYGKKHMNNTVVYICIPARPRSITSSPRRRATPIAIATVTPTGKLLEGSSVGPSIGNQ